MTWSALPWPWLAALQVAWFVPLVLLAWWRVERRIWSIREVGLTVGAAIVWSVFALGWWGPRLAPATTVPLREGFTLSHLRMLTGVGADTGVLRDTLWVPAVSWTHGLRAVVTVDLWFAGLAGLVFAVFAHRARLPGIVLVGMAIAGPLGDAWRTAALSESGAALVGFHGLVGAGLYALAVDERTPRRERLLATVGALASGLCLVAVRVELSVLALAAVVGLAVYAVGWAPRIEGVAGRAVAWLRARPVVILLAGAAWVGASWAWYDGAGPLRAWGSWAWLIRGLHPLHVHGLSLPVAVAGTSSLGMLVLVAWGLPTVLSRPVRWAALPAVVWVLYVTWRQAAHGSDVLDSAVRLAPWELYRYLLLLQPWIWLVALQGARRAQGPWAGVVLGLCLLPPLGRAPQWLGVEPADASWRRHDLPAQEEVRRLWTEREARPGCAVLTLGAPWGTMEPALQWAALVPWGDGWLMRDAPGSDPTDPAAGLALVQDQACVWAWRGLDCEAMVATEDGPVADAGLPGCAALEGLGTPEFTTVAGPPFVHPQHGLTWPRSLRVGVVPVRDGTVGPGR